MRVTFLEIIQLLLFVLLLGSSFWLRIVADRCEARGGNEQDKKFHKLVRERSTDKYMLLGAIGMLLMSMQDYATR